MSLMIDKSGNRKLEISDRARITISFSISLVIVLACLFLIYPSPENNDDMNIHKTTAGIFGEPEQFLFHEGVLLTRFYVLVQEVFPTLNVVAAAEYIFGFLAIALFAALIWLIRPNSTGFALSLFLSLVVAPYFYDKLHYTKYSIVIGAMGVLILFLSSKEKVRLGFLVSGFILCAFSFLLRPSGFLCGEAVTGFVCLLYILFESGKAVFADNKKRIVVFVSLAVMIAALFAADELMWRSDETAFAAREYNSARLSISDYFLPSYAENRETYEALGVSANDVKIIDSWSFGDTEIYNTELLEAIHEIPNQRGAADWLTQFAATVIEIDVLSVSFYAAVALVVLSFFICEKKEKIVCILSLVFYYVVVISLCVVGRTTRWVETGMLCALCGALLATLSQSKREISPRSEKIIATVLISASLVFAVAYNYPKATSEEVWKSSSVTKTYGELTAKSENLYLCDLSTMPALERGFETFERVPQGFFSNIYLLGGWDTGLKVKNDVLVRYKVTSPYAALLEKDNVFLVDSFGYESKAQVVREHVSETARYSLYETISGQYVFVFADNKNADKMIPEIEITAADSELLDINNSFLRIYVSAKVELEYKNAYIMLRSKSNDTNLTYRAYVLYNENGESGFSITPPKLDVLGEEYDMFVLLETEDGTISSSSEAFLFKT